MSDTDGAPKPGVRTSEGIGSGAVAVGLLSMAATATGWQQVALGACVAAVAIGYAISRGLAKRGGAA